MSRQSHFLAPLLRDRSQDPRLYVADGSRLVATVLESAFDSASRKRGLLGRTHLPDGHALVIAPCSGVHTFKMQFPIDVIYAGRDGRVIKLRPNMPPGRLSAALRAFATIEMAAGAIARAKLEVGDQLVVG
jgi:uncharacterized membrane protein (UPF0127 family)